MSSQINQMRVQFNGMNNPQKKQFIDNLKVKLQNSNNAEYKKFLNECIQNYNTAVKGTSVGATSKGGTSSPIASSSGAKQPSICATCGESVNSSEKRCPNCLTPNNSNNFTKKIDGTFIFSIVALLWVIIWISGPVAGLFLSFGFDDMPAFIIGGIPSLIAVFIARTKKSQISGITFKLGMAGVITWIAVTLITIISMYSGLTLIIWETLRL